MRSRKKQKHKQWMRKNPLQKTKDWAPRISLN